MKLVAGLHAYWWDFQVVLRLESLVCWCRARWEDLCFEFGDFIVADQDAWRMLCIYQLGF